MLMRKALQGLLPRYFKGNLTLFLMELIVLQSRSRAEQCIAVLRAYEDAWVSRLPSTTKFPVGLTLQKLLVIQIQALLNSCRLGR